MSFTVPATRPLYKTPAVLWTVLCVLAACALATPAAAAQVPVPPYSARVLDTTATLDTAQIAALNAQILALEADTQAAIVVYMLPTTGEEAIEEYATRVFEAWKLGDAKRDDGILVLVALQDRRMRIEVGQGLEGTVPDVLAGRIIAQQMKPHFQDKDYAGGLEAAINSLGALVRGDAPAPADAPPGGVTPFGWAFIAALLWGFAVGVARALRAWKWPVTIGVLAAVPVVAAAVLTDAGMAAILLSFPAPLAFALGFGCGRSGIVRWIAGGFVGVIGLLVGIGYAVGADRFWWGFLYAMAGGVACLLLTLIVMGMRMAWQRSLLEFGVRCAVVAGIVGYVAFENPPGSLWTDWESWLPTAAAAGLSMLFGFFPGSMGGGSGSDSSSSSGSSSSSSSGSSSRSSSGGSSSGGGASGSW
ncbi:TPM domain-containing protein [Polaromonas sp. YR568]|uniref:TPM domain-containing protein n=1 Tax=Polaromonas sp. YR568 TaxID=1855301 RepID=UPI00398BD5B9